MERTLGELAELVGGEVRGDPGLVIDRVATLEDAGPGDLSFLTNLKYRQAALESRAGALLVAQDSTAFDCNLLVASDPYQALGRILELFVGPEPAAPGIHPSASLAASAVVDETAHIGAFCVLGERAVIGANARLGAHCVVGEDCRIGADSRLHPRVTLYARSEVGERCILHSGVVIGGDGYGYASSGGVHRKLPHLGRAVLEDDVEIGANSAVDRALLGETRIGEGTKIDDLVMVGHNVRVGRGCLLVAQAGIAGSSRLGDHVTMAGQSGIIGHVELGDGVVVAAKSAVMGTLEPGRQVAGIPAVDLPKWRRQQALIGRLDGLRRQVRGLERRLAEILDSEDEGGK